MTHQTHEKLSELHRKKGRKAVAIGAATATLIATAGILGPVAFADDQTVTSVSAGYGHGLSTDIVGMDLAGTASALAQWTPNGSTSHAYDQLNLGLLGAKIDLGNGLQLPLIAQAGGAGLLELGSLGLLSSWASTPYQSVSEVSSGVLTDDGALALDAAEQPGFRPAKLDVSAMLEQLLGATVREELLNTASFEVGALGAHLRQSGADLTSEYMLSSVGMDLQSNLVAGLTDTLDGTLEDTFGVLSNLLDLDGGALAGVINTLVGALDLALKVPSLGAGGVTLDAATVNLDPLFASIRTELLANPLSNADGSLSISLADGSIHIDLAKIVMDAQGITDLNSLPANTEVLSGTVVNSITSGLLDLLVGSSPNSLVGKIVNLVNDGIYDSSINISLTLDGGALLGKGTLAIQGSLGSLLGVEGYPALQPTPAGGSGLLDIVLPLVGGIVTGLAGVVGPVVTPILDGLLTNLAPTLSAVLDPLVTGLLDDAIGPVLSNIVSLTINQQPAVGDFGGDSHTVRALAVTVLPNAATPLVSVKLGSATVQADADAPNPGDVNTNASASASASGAANGNNEAAAQAAAQAAAMADASTSANAGATANAEAAASTAATAQASSDAATTAEGSAQAAAQGANDSASNTASNASASAAANGNPNGGAAASVAAQATSSNDASADAAANGTDASANVNAADATANTNGADATANTNGADATANTNGADATANTNGASASANTNGADATANTNGASASANTNGASASANTNGASASANTNGASASSNTSASASSSASSSSNAASSSSASSNSSASASASGASSSSNANGGAVGLPTTGSGDFTAAWILGMLLLGAGAFALVARRRQSVEAAVRD